MTGLGWKQGSCWEATGITIGRRSLREEYVVFGTGTEMGIIRGDADRQRGIVRDEGVDVSLVVSW